MSIGTYNKWPAIYSGERRINPNDWNDVINNLTGSQIKTGSFAVIGPTYFSGSLVLSGSSNVPGTVSVQQAGTLIGSRSTINLTSGSGINLAVTDDSVNSRITVLINTGSGIGSGGGAGYNLVQDEGTGLTSRTILNIVGSTIKASDDSGNSRTLITADSYASTTGSISPITVGAVAATGSNKTIADSGHIHASPATWVPSAHASTHYVGASDQLTGTLTVSSINISGGLIVGGSSTITGSLNVGGSETITGSVIAAGASFSGNITGSIITGSILASGINSSGNITGSIITGSGFQTLGASTLGSIIILSGSNLYLQSGSFVVSGSNL